MYIKFISIRKNYICIRRICINQSGVMYVHEQVCRRRQGATCQRKFLTKYKMPSRILKHHQEHEDI